MTTREILNSIRFGNFTNEDLNEIVEAVRYARSQLSRDVRRNLAPGMSVSFVNDRNGRRFHGTVDSIKIKNAIVTVGSTRYRVPCNMLETDMES